MLKTGDELKRDEEMSRLAGEFLHAELGKLDEMTGNRVKDILTAVGVVNAHLGAGIPLDVTTAMALNELARIIISLDGMLHPQKGN